jgi:hypothetical protein
MKTFVLGAVLAAGLGAPAQAAVTYAWLPDYAGDFATFNNAAIGSTSGSSQTDEGAITWSTTGDSWATVGTIDGVHRAPSDDTTTYLFATTGSNVEITWASDINSFMIYWGSPDWYNTLTLVDSAGDVIGAVTGTEILAETGASPGLDGAYWIRVSSDVAFDEIIVSSSAPAFEFDMAAPEPATWAMMGLGFAALGFIGYRRSANRLAARA